MSSMLTPSDSAASATLACGAKPGASTPRMIQLDVLRGVAVLAVLGRHEVIDPNSGGHFRYLAKVWDHLGWTGVDLFFVLSGFLVGGLLMSELRIRHNLDIKRFVIRRAFKIWPAYYTLVLGSLLIDGYQTGWHNAFWLYLPNIFHIQNYVGYNPLGQTWSLAVEEQFYLVFPCLLWIITRGGRRGGGIHALPFIALAIMIGCTAARCVLNWNRPFNNNTHYFPTHLRMDGLAMGVMIAYFYHFRPELLRRIGNHQGLLLFFGALFISPMAVLELFKFPFVWTVGFTMLYLGYGCILIAFIHTPIGDTGGVLGRFFAGISARVLATVGFFSYSMYLWHLQLVRHPMAKVIARSTFLNFSQTLHWLLWMSLYPLAVFIVGVILGKAIEIPALVVRDRLFPSRAPAIRPMQTAAAQI